MKLESKKYVLNKHLSTAESHFTSATINSFSPPGVYDDQSQATSISYIKGAFQAPLAKAEHDIHADFSMGSLDSFVKESKRSRRQKVAFYLILIFLVMCGIAGAAAYAMGSDDQESTVDSGNAANPSSDNSESGTEDPTITPTEASGPLTEAPLPDEDPLPLPDEDPLGDDIVTNAPTNLPTQVPTPTITISQTGNPTPLPTANPTAKPTEPPTESGFQPMKFSIVGLTSLVFSALPDEQFITHIQEAADSVEVFSFQDGTLNNEGCDTIPEYPCEFGVLSDIPTQGVCSVDNQCAPLESFNIDIHEVSLELGGEFDNLVTECLAGIEQVACIDHNIQIYSVVVVECLTNPATEIIISINPDTLFSGPCQFEFV